MPTYAYACSSCGHQFDAVQSFSDDALTVCPECGGALRKQYGSIGVTFNGSGFYRTDSRAASGGTKSESSSSKTESTTSAKPAAASTPTSS
jgi:putative FmdB family regulatory protein